MLELLHKLNRIAPLSQREKRGFQRLYGLVYNRQEPFVLVQKGEDLVFLIGTLTGKIDVTENIVYFFTRETFRGIVTPHGFYQSAAPIYTENVTPLTRQDLANLGEKIVLSTGIFDVSDRLAEYQLPQDLYQRLLEDNNRYTPFRKEGLSHR